MQPTHAPSKQTAQQSALRHQLLREEREEEEEQQQDENETDHQGKNGMKKKATNKQEKKARRPKTTREIRKTKHSVPMKTTLPPMPCLFSCSFSALTYHYFFRFSLRPLTLRNQDPRRRSKRVRKTLGGRFLAGTRFDVFSTERLSQ